MRSFSGLNLTFECREGILKHCSVQNARKLGDVGERFIKRTQPGLEAQLANLADAIAYNNHDVDDGVRAGLINVEELREVRVFARFHAVVAEEYSGICRATAAIRNHPPHGRLSCQRPDRGIPGRISRPPKSNSIDAVRAQSAAVDRLSEEVLESTRN